MRRLPTGEPMWDLEFDEKGKLWAPAVEDFLKEVVTEGIADLFMFSHGWDTSERSASQLYDAMFPMIRNAAGGAARLGTVGFVGIHWPTLRLRALPGPSTCGARSAGPGRRRRPRRSRISPRPLMAICQAGSGTSRSAARSRSPSTQPTE